MHKSLVGKEPMNFHNTEDPRKNYSSTKQAISCNSISDSQDLSENFRPIRVLLVVDSLYWGIGNFALQIKKNNPYLEALIYSQFAIRKTVKRFGSFPASFDVVHYLTAAPLNLWEGIFPTVTTLHHIDSETSFEPLHKGDAVMTVSNQWLKYLKQRDFPHEKLGLVPFGVDTKTFHPPTEIERWEIRKTLTFQEKDFIVGFSGKSTSNVDGRKGLHSFIEALKDLHSQIPNVKALIIGPGWQTLIRTLSAEGIACTYFPYQIDHEKIAKWYQALDVLWVPSTIEGGPVPLLEAMATGIPCISTPVGAALDLIENFQNGFIVDFDSPDQFVNISLQLAKDLDLRKQIGKQGRKTIIQQRQWTFIQKEMLNLYHRAIHNFHKRQHQSKPHAKIENGSFTESQNHLKHTPKAFNTFSPKIQKWIKACEHLNGLKMLLKLGEWRAAIRMTFRTLIIAPFDHHIWLELRKISKKEGKGLLHSSQTSSAKEGGS